ncbi:MAG: tyrosine-type recombinase/integrase [Planctomycetales bacterium]|nr:tyrosine-type recombinase/integrase [Planctomycetales bacterium]
MADSLLAPILPYPTALPALISHAGDSARKRYLEFFTASIRNKGTRQAYSHAVNRFFCWCQEHGIALEDIEPIVVATYVEWMTLHYSAPTVKLHLAAIRMLFDFLVTGHIIATNPAASVRGPKHVVKKGKTPVLTAAEARLLLDSIETDTVIGLRDRALVGVMIYSFARVSATLGMNVEDIYLQGRRMWFRLHEKGGKYHEVPAHHNAEAYIDAYLLAAGIRELRKSPLFRTVAAGILTERRMHRIDALRMIKRRARAAGLPDNTCCHTFRATGITAYLSNEGTLERAMQIAAHESARTTKLYDRTCDEVSLDEIERIRI